MGQTPDERAATVLKALGHPTRVWLVRRLGREEACVCELLRELGISQPLLSQHLQILRRAGVVWARRDGTRMIYGLAHQEYADLLALLDGVLGATPTPTP